jgi:hypothetical protein
MTDIRRTLFNIAAIAIVLPLWSPESLQAGTVTVSWDAVSKAAGYVLHWGTASHTYSKSVDVGSSTSFKVDVPYETTPHYFAVQAYSSTGVRSAFSEEVSTTALSDPRPKRRRNTLNDFDGDGRSDALRLRAARYTGGISYPSGKGDDLAVPADYDGDGRFDMAIFRPSSGEWHIQKSSGEPSEVYLLGGSTDVPVPGDYDGDGRADPTIYQPSTGVWLIKLSGSQYQQTASYKCGERGDVPVAADYDGDGRFDLAVYRPATGEWIVRLWSGDGITKGYSWGGKNDKPVPGDYDGDGKADLAVFRPEEGIWHILSSSSGSRMSHAWGASTDELAPGDYDGDGRTDLAVYRESEGKWYVRESSSNYTSSAVY